MAHFIFEGRPANLVQVAAGAEAIVDLWGGGPGGAPLDVRVSDPAASLREAASPGPNLRRLHVRGVHRGSLRLQAWTSTSSQIWADTRILVGVDEEVYRYYHGTNSAIADLLLSNDLTPMFVASLYGLGATAFDWSDYTDFGKGFYTHLYENRAMAWEWARRRFVGDWAVVEFVVTRSELQPVWSTALHFNDKTSRPANAPVLTTASVRRTPVLTVPVCPIPFPVPQLLPCIDVTIEREELSIRSSTMSWREFVEYNRHINPGGALIARPNDRDWSGTYSRIRGPLWVPRDSGYGTGLPPFPDHVHQLNWGQAGMNQMNQPQAKIRRYKFSAANEGIFPPP